MTWLLRDGDVLRGPALVQTLTPSHARALDVAWCSPAERAGDGRHLRVRRLAVVGRYRISIPHLGGGGLVVAPAGTFERWRLRVGDRLELCEA